MKLRLCRISFHRDTKVQIDGSVKTKKIRDEVLAIELGNVMSFGKEHWSGIISSDIGNIGLVKDNIQKLENLDSQGRIDWFSENFPKAKLIQMDAILIVDLINGVKDNMGQSPAVTIDSAVQLDWK